NSFDPTPESIAAPHLLNPIFIALLRTAGISPMRPRPHSNRLIAAQFLLSLFRKLNISPPAINETYRGGLKVLFMKSLIQAGCTMRQRIDLIEFIYSCRRYANSRSAKFAKRDWIQGWPISMKIKQLGSQSVRSKRAFFKSGDPVARLAFERIWADTP